MKDGTKDYTTSKEAFEEVRKYSTTQCQEFKDFKKGDNDKRA